ncbi:Protein of unknown function [Pyronema omphalodes CBS 100304]|uniref:Uncharacterized protein n=1 Tax=Pyronema omphalodes (strain CBS 100304) TaxID=1076935 RepID=U4LY87_PYROM|nr:Protein of unknown function [Pyronema omphalodes CBS 100304]
MCGNTNWNSGIACVILAVMIIGSIVHISSETTEKNQNVLPGLLVSVLQLFSSYLIIVIYIITCCLASYYHQQWWIKTKQQMMVEKRQEQARWMQEQLALTPPPRMAGRP